MIFSFKLSPTLFDELQELAQESGKSKGTLIRLALKMYLEKNNNFKSRINRLTDKLLQSKKKQTSWSSIYNKTRVNTNQSPEEEVFESRRRGL